MAPRFYHQATTVAGEVFVMSYKSILITALFGVKVCHSAVEVGLWRNCSFLCFHIYLNAVVDNVIIIGILDVSI